jgi:beta-N-acetylhexosaminidase
LKELAGVLMGDIQAEGCIPGEKKFVGKLRKRKSIDSQNTGEKHNQVKERRSSQPKRRWLVDEFDLKRDWAGLINIWKSNTDTNSNVDDLTVNVSNNQSGEITYQDESFYKKMYQLLSTTANTQKHFVIRNSSLNILYGFVLTWVDDSQGVPLDGDLTKLDNIQKKTGSIMYLLVDKSKRLQSIGKNLHARAIRYLTKEQKCTSLTLGCSFPLLVLPKNSNLLTNNKVVSFMNNVGWDVSNDYSKKHIMVLYDLNNWLVPKKIFRELTIVGVRFDVCTDPQKLMNLIHSSILQHDKLVKNSIRLGTRMREDKDNTKEVYIEAIKYLTNSPSYGVKIIIALEPTNQNIIGSIILFTNKSQMSKFYPFLEECLKDSKTLENLNLQDPLIGGIMAPVIDPSYSNLTEIINFGLICSAITFAKTGFNDNDQNQMNKCVMMGINDDNLGNISGIKEIGFEEWKYFYDFYDAKNDVEKSFLGE